MGRDAHGDGRAVDRWRALDIKGKSAILENAHYEADLHVQRATLGRFNRAVLESVLVAIHIATLRSVAERSWGSSSVADGSC